MLIFSALTGWAAVKHCGGGGISESEIREGLAWTATGIASTEIDAFRRAEPHYVDAASVSILDGYPAFLLHANRQLEAVAKGGEGPPITRAIARQDWAAAREYAAKMGEPKTKPRIYWERLIDGLELSVSRARHEAP